MCLSLLIEFLQSQLETLQHENKELKSTVNSLSAQVTRLVNENKRDERSDFGLTMSQHAGQLNFP